MPATRRTPKTPPRVQAVLRVGGWRFRARIQHLGAVTVGPQRTTPEEAVRDVQELLAARASLTGPTLGSALVLVEQEARRIGLEPETVDRSIVSPARALLRTWAAGMPLALLTADELERFVRARTAAGRRGTGTRKLLGLLRRALALASAPTAPVDEAARRCRRLLRASPRLARILTAAEVRELAQRLAAASSPVAHRLADLVLLVAATGLRAHELARVRVEHFVDGPHGLELMIEKPKIRHLPRRIPLDERLRPLVERLTASAHDGHLVVLPQVRTALRRWSQRLGEPRLNLRALRKAHATAALVLGATPGELQATLGHSNTATASHYVDAAAVPLRALASQLSQELLA
jgi:integrase